MHPAQMPFGWKGRGEAAYALWTLAFCSLRLRIYKRELRMCSSLQWRAAERAPAWACSTLQRSPQIKVLACLVADQKSCCFSALQRSSNIYQVMIVMSSELLSSQGPVRWASLCGTTVAAREPGLLASHPHVSLTCWTRAVSLRDAISVPEPHVK